MQARRIVVRRVVGGRIVKKIENSRDWDCTYVYYYDGQKLIETHNGSEQVISEHLWGLQYIDELVQIAAGDDPADAGEDVCESVYHACHNANFNVLGVVDDSGELVERYEYTPYGERVVFVSSGTGDADTSAPALESARVVTAGSVTQPYGLCEVGHQGLIHDKETALIYNRARMHHPRLGRFVQRDPLGYVDGMGLYVYVGSSPCSGRDPLGKAQDFTPSYPFAKGRELSVEDGTFTLLNVWDHLAKIADPPLVVDAKKAASPNPAKALTAEAIAATKRKVVLYANGVTVKTERNPKGGISKWRCLCDKGEKLAFSKRAAVLRTYLNDKKIDIGVQGAVESLEDILASTAEKIADPKNTVIAPGLGSIIPQMNTGVEAGMELIKGLNSPFDDIAVRSQASHNLIDDLAKTVKFMDQDSKDLISLVYTMKCVKEDTRGKYQKGFSRKLARMKEGGEKYQYVRSAQQVTSGGEVVPLRVTEEHIVQYFDWN